MKKLKKGVLMLLIATLLILWTTPIDAKIPTVFKKIELNQLEATLIFPAPRDKFIVYRIPGGYRLINDFFWEKINLKLNQYKAKEEIVDPVKDEIINNPQNIKWYQGEGAICIGGIVTVTITGILTIIAVGAL